MNVAVLSGGSSLERDVSLRSGARVIEALRDLDYAVSPLDLDERLVQTLLDGTIDVVFLALHGRAGEDGTIQRLLDLLGLPYTGPDATASALAWDKSVSKGILRRGGVATPDWWVLAADAVRDHGAGSALDQLIDRLTFPLVVKPVQGGASLGVRIVDRPDDVADAIMSSFNYDSSAMLETYVPGTEVAVSIVDGTPLPAVEIQAPDSGYDFAARYTHGATSFHVPARLDEAVAAACVRAAEDAWSLLGCRDIMRADMIVDADGVAQVLEVDTCPGLTRTSLLPLAAEAHGIGFAKLCERLVTLARQRGQRTALADAPAP